MNYHSINGKIIHTSDAKISVFDLAIARGYGIFDFFKVHDTVPVFIDDHLARFERGAKFLHLNLPLSVPEIEEQVYTLMEKNQIRDGTFKLILTGGVSSNGFTMDGTPNLIILAGGLSFEIYTSFDKIKHLKLKSIDYVRETPNAKTINYLVAMQSWPEVMKGGYDDVLYLKDRLVTESSRANIFFVTPDQKLVTPKNNILEGITRKHLLDIARDLMPVEERNITWDEMLVCPEIFVSSTTKQAMPVVKIDDHLVGSGQGGEITKTLFEKFYQFEMDYIKANKAIRL